MSEDPYGKEAYMRAMVEARRERDEYISQLDRAYMDADEWLDTLARALGIQTGRESWWESTRDAQRAKVLERIKRLKTT